MLKRVQHDAFFKKIRFKMHHGYKINYLLHRHNPFDMRMWIIVH